MANSLLQLAALEQGAAQLQETRTMTPTRSFLYSPDCPEGRIFEGADAIADALESGWVDSPAALTEPAPPAPVKPVSGGKKAAKGDHST